MLPPVCSRSPRRHRLYANGHSANANPALQTGEHVHDTACMSQVVLCAGTKDYHRLMAETYFEECGRIQPHARAHARTRARSRRLCAYVTGRMPFFTPQVHDPVSPPPPGCACRESSGRSSVSRRRAARGTPHSPSARCYCCTTPAGSSRIRSSPRSFRSLSARSARCRCARARVRHVAASGWPARA